MSKEKNNKQGTGSSSPSSANKRRGRAPKAKVAAAQSATKSAAKKRPVRSRKVVPAVREPVPARRIVLRQGVSLAAYRKSLAEVEAASEAAAASRAKSGKDTRRAVSIEPGYAPPQRRIVVREGHMDAYLESLRAPELPVEEHVPAAVAVVTADTGGSPPVLDRPLRRKRVIGPPRASMLAALARKIDGEVAALVVPDVVPKLVYEGDPPPPRKRPGRKPAVVSKKRRAKSARATGGARRGRKPRKPGVLSAGARRRTVAPK